MNGQIVKLKHETSYIVVLPLISNQKKVCLRTDDSKPPYRIPCSRTINHTVDNNTAREIAIRITKKLGGYKSLQFCFVFSNKSASEKIYFFICELIHKKNSTKKIYVSAKKFLYKVTLCTLSDLVRGKLIEIMNQTNKAGSQKKLA